MVAYYQRVFITATTICVSELNALLVHLKRSLFPRALSPLCCSKMYSFLSSFNKQITSLNNVTLFLAITTNVTWSLQATVWWIYHKQVDFIWLTRVEWIIDVYELFGLSFWRHPFTAEDPLVSDRCNAKFLTSFPIKKQAHLHLGWPEGEYMFSIFFWGEPVLQYLCIHKRSGYARFINKSFFWMWF